MFSTTHEYDQLKKPNSHRRYILESPVGNSKPKEYSHATKSSSYGVNEDLWVKEKDIDLSKFDQQEEQIQILNIPNINDSKSPLIIYDKTKRKTDQYQSINSTQSKSNNLFSFLNRLVFQSKSSISKMDSSTINK
jgi:hypothetical protein